MFTSVMESVSSTLSLETAAICTGVSLLLGLVIAGIYWVQKKFSENYLVTLLLLPALVQVVIMLVNGNLGTGVAVMGAFSLVRFRSLPGNAKEIMGIFFAMVVGLATGMGYITYAIVITVIIGVTMLLVWKVNFGKNDTGESVLKITIPESLDYAEVFDDLFVKYTSTHHLHQVKTTNMGSMYELQYHVVMKGNMKEKDFMDELRCRNGNLTISYGRKSVNTLEL